jgi:hypothetical protein
MAFINPQTKEFKEVLDAVNSAEGDVEQQLSILKDKNIEPADFLQTLDELKTAQDITGDASQFIGEPAPTGFAPSKAVAGGIARGVKALGTIGSQVIEGAGAFSGVEGGGKKAREKVENVFQEAADYVDSSIKQIPGGTAITEAAKKTFDPELSTAEEIGAFFVPFAGATKALGAATKAIKPTSRLGTATKAGSIGVAADVLTREEDEVFLPEIISLLGPEAEELAAAITINPDDTVAEKRLKQIADSTLGAGVASGLIKSLGFAGRKTLGKAQALRQKVTEPIEETVDKTPLEARVVETAPNEYRQQGKIKQTVGKINTGLGRLFTSTAGMPKSMFDSYIKSKGFPEGMDLIVQGEAKKLDKLIKKTKVNRQDVNRALLGEDVPGLPQEVVDQVKVARNMINENQTVIRDVLNVGDESEFGLALADDGSTYLTRIFEFTTNPQWSKEIVKALKGELKGTSGHNADVLEVVSNARKHIQKNNPNLTTAQVDGVIETIINKGKKGNQVNIITDLLGGGTGGAAVKVLKGRKDIDKPILELLGEVKDPVRNFRETMRNQNKLIAKSNFLNDVKKFAEDNVGKEIKTKGLFPFLPSETATFLNKAEVGVSRDVGELAQKELGRLGGSGEPFGLNKFTTTDTLYNMLEKGIDVFGFDNPVGKGWLNVFAKPAGVTQAMETVFDHTAHLVNTYGMLQQLGMNGNLLRPSIFKNANKAAYNVYQKAAKNNPEALQYLAKLKERGVIDSSVVAETVKRNVDRFGEGAEGALTKAVKAPFRGASAVYGGVDDFGKVIAMEAETAAYRKAFPNASDEEVFNYAADVVRNTMPSYSTAIPAVRALSRLPFGTYATFPAEVLRTQYNIIKTGLKDLRTGVTTGNAALASTGLRRLSALGGITAGIEYAVRENNEELGVSPEDIRGINLMVPEYQKNTTKVMTKPLTMDPKTGHIMTQFTDSGSLDAAQYVKGPIRAILGRVMASEDVTDREIDDVFKDAFREVYSPFVSEKFLTRALVNAYTGMDEEGRPIRRGLSLADDIKATGLELGKILIPGSIKAGQKVLRAEQSEMLRGVGEGQTAAGFPLRKEEQMIFFTRGVRNNTMDVTKAMGYSLYEDSNAAAGTKDAFKNFIKQIPDRPLEESDVQDIVNEYRRLQEIKKERMARLSDKINVFRNMSYIDNEGNEKKVGLQNIIKASTSDSKYPIDNKLIYASVRGPKGNGVFIPDSLSTNELINLVKDRKFPFDVVKQLKREEANFIGKPLREEKQ